MTSMEKYLSLLEEEIRKQQYGSEPASLYDPIRYIMRLGGKRIRPLFTLFSYSLYKDDAQNILPYASAVEVFHNFTLMHDDIMDQAPLRRGKASVHEKWNVNTAILAGDAMLVSVYETFRGLDAGKLKEVLARFNECATEVCEGQQRDMEFEQQKKVTVAEYIAMIRSKTAALLGFSLELGAMLADAPKRDAEILKNFGISMGIAFQLKDDLLDAYGDKKKFGKQQGGDILANKKTFLLINAVLLAKGKEKIELQRWLAAKKFDKKRKIASVSSIFNSLGVRELTEKKIQEYVENGFRLLNDLSVKQRASDLIHFVKTLEKRQL